MLQKQCGATACEEQVKTCMREKKSHMSRSNIASYAWPSQRTTLGHTLFFGTGCTGNVCCRRKTFTPTLGSRATLCARCTTLPFRVRGAWVPECQLVQTMQCSRAARVWLKVTSLFLLRMRHGGCCALFSSSGHAAC